MLPSYENLVEAAYKIEAIDAGISEAVHSTQWAWYTLGITRSLIRDLPMEYYFSRDRFFSSIGIGISRRF